MLSLAKSIARSTLSLPLRVALRDSWNELKTQRLHRRGARAAKRYADRRKLKLNLGCGQNIKSDWVNVDLYEPTADLALDLRERLPFPDNSAEIVYCEHVFEHFALPAISDPMGWTLEGAAAPSEALQFLREARRVLAPGGVLNIGVPDAERAVRMYMQQHFETWGPPWVDTPMHFLNYVFRQGREHKYAYDAETLLRLVSSIGFVQVRRRPFLPALDSEHRKNDTLYVEAMKPREEL